MAEQVTLLDLSFDTSEALDGLDALIAKSLELAETKKSLQSALKDEKKQLDEAGKAFKSGSISQDEYKKAVSDSTKAQVDLTKQLTDTNKSISDNNAAIKVNTTLLSSQEDSVDALRAQLAKNTKELNAMSAATRNNTDEGKALVTETKEISDRLKEMEKAVGDNRRNVGNYAESVQEALSSTQGLSGATGSLVSSLNIGTQSFKAFTAVVKANPLLAIISLVLLLASTIEKLVKRNSEAAAALKAAFAPFEVIFSRILDGVTDMLTGVAKAFEWISDKVVSLLSSIGLITEETTKAANAAKELSQQELAIYEAETDNLVTVSAMRRELEAQKTIVGDQLKSMSERNAAAQKGIAILKQMEAAEVGVLKQKYEQIKAQNELGYTSKEDRRAEMQALADLQSKQAEYISQRKELENQASGLVKQQNAANAAAFKANEEKKAQAAIKAAQEAEAAKRELQEQTIKQFEEARTKLELSLQEKEIGNDSIALKLENEKAYVEESLKLERYRLEQGLISQQEFANREQAFQLGVLQLEQQMREEQDRTEKERKALDEANLKELKMANITNEYELRQAALDAQYQQEIAAAEKIGADTALIQSKYEKAKEDNTKARVNAELTMTAGLAGQMSTLLGEESAIGKAFGVVQATINTYIGATKALAQGGILGIAQAAVVIAFGMKQVASIAKQKEPDTKVSSVKKYAKGGQIFGKSHAQGGVTFRGDNGQVFEAEGGENVYILKKSASAEINALSAVNEAHGGNSFATSGLYKFADGGMAASISEANRMVRQSDNMRLSSESINQLAGVVIDAVMSMPNPVVSVQDINAGQNDVSVVQGFATF
nr:MAG TPA: tail length tape measure protein [Caudoviricetes sp.]